ncbi:DUF418 domain-containing protein [Sphingomonas sp. S-NIH.Pt15_0812]|uniref:DUF418 domain-containing protein n=1 Tax=Sphingomonas sp. S-NIH.Pt15_0812 TaxID=1920129 RepID=UPI001F497706|nr:DUF418 domain-containing protein [Sphingomonas sp. S-NIH.Pt15_0812]
MTDPIAPSDPTAPAASEPDGAPRIAALDILRGLAILGILFMNMPEMAGSIWAGWTDPRHYGWSPADQWVWWLRELFAEGTARCLLELLFGAGMVILTDRIAARAGEVAMIGRYAWRQVVLFAFGLVHMFVLLWPGDILHTYAVAALLGLFFRTRSPQALLALGLVMTVFDFAGGVASYQAARQQQAVMASVAMHRAAGQPLTSVERAGLVTERDRLAELARRKARDEGRIALEDRMRSSGFTDWVRSAWSTGIVLLRDGELDSVWEALSTMLIGAALYRWGVLQGERSSRLYAALAVAGYGLGISLRVMNAAATLRFDGAPTMGWATYEVGRLAVTMGHVGLVLLVLGTSLGRRLLRPFAAAGRTALTLYVAQTLICLWLLYPPFALGLYGRQDWVAMMLTALAVDAVLLVAANIWVRHYRIAPVEWAWRSLVEGRRLRFRN